MQARFLALLLTSALAQAAAPPALSVSPNGRFLQQEGAKPFFWLGDTGWLLAKNLTREEAARYLDDRAKKGFNVVQVMVLHTAKDRNAYDMAALDNGNPGRPVVTPGARLEQHDEYDYWDHLDWLVEQAGERGIYLALVPSWGALVKKGELNATNVRAYAEFLARRYRERTNVIWLVGGDLQGSVHPEVWKEMGMTLKRIAPHQLVSYHPFGRTDSSEWFHDEPWLDFNMFQSGHQDYAQDPNGKGEDNWRFVREDYARKPVKPTLDGEPSYENIPHGLHDAKGPRWTADDVRRYAYWGVFAGGFGHTYGENGVMQMFRPKAGVAPNFGNRLSWEEGIAAPGSSQMQYLKKLILSRPFFERVPDDRAVAGETGTRYERVLATRTRGSLMVYTYTGRPFEVDLSVLGAKRAVAWWYSPRDGQATRVGSVDSNGKQRFTPPGEAGPGRDWVLVLDDEAAGFGAPGR